MSDRQYFQDYLPGDTCFGCGTANEKGLGIKSFWQGEDSICIWKPQDFHQGWPGLTCGGVIATLIDCHCIATATATAIRSEARPLDSEPHYLFVTGTLSVKYLKPTLMDGDIKLVARVTEVKKETKYTLHCDVYSGDELTASADVIVLRVYRSDDPEQAPEVFRQAACAHST